MDKRIELSNMVEAVRDDDLVSFGGGGLLRKPMGAACALAASAISKIRVAAFLGGPEVDVLIGAGKISAISYAFVGMDFLGLSPNFRVARENASLTAYELSEVIAIRGFEAAAKNIPFFPTRSGLGVDLLDTSTTPLRRFSCPVTGAQLVAVPATVPDIAFLHVNVADHSGNCIILGDAFIDPLVARAAKKTFVTAEKVVEKLPKEHGPGRANYISRIWVDGVCELPGGASFTSMYPDYPVNLEAAMDYQKNATNPDWLAEFIAR